MFEVDRQKMKRYRKKSRYTLAGAGRAIGGSTYNKLWAIENGKTKHLRAKDLFTLAALYGVNPNELVVKK